MSDRPTDAQIKEAVATEMKEMAPEVESLTFAEVYGYDRDAIGRAHYWQARAHIAVTFDE